MNFEKLRSLVGIDKKLKEGPNTLKSEHLKDGVSPIIACVGTPEQLKENLGAEQEILGDTHLNNRVNNSKNVDYYGKPEDLRQKKFKNPDRNSYVISAIDSENKFSKSFLNCTGLVVTGIDKLTGENISFLSHQDPSYFVGNSETNQKNFVNDLEEILEEIKERSLEGTIDAVIVGGNYFPEDSDVVYSSEEFREAYLKSIGLLRKKVQGVLGFQPVVITGPKTTRGRDDVFYENNNRRLYIVRPDVGDETTKSYLPDKIKEQENKW